MQFSWKFELIWARILEYLVLDQATELTFIAQCECITMTIQKLPGVEGIKQSWILCWLNQPTHFYDDSAKYKIIFLKSIFLFKLILSLISYLIVYEWLLINGFLVIFFQQIPWSDYDCNLCGWCSIIEIVLALSIAWCRRLQ